jgi:hypothetical protein
MAGARDWVRKHLGEGTARAIEKAAAVFFGDDCFVECRFCKTPVPATLISEWGCCPNCKVVSDELADSALLARREATLQKGEEAKKELEKIERLLAAKQSSGQ